MSCRLLTSTPDVRRACEQDMLKHLGHRLTLLLPCLLAMVVSMLEAACASLTSRVRCWKTGRAHLESVLHKHKYEIIAFDIRHIAGYMVCQAC